MTDLMLGWESHGQHELFLNHFEVNAYWLMHSVNIHLDSHHTDDIIFLNNHYYSYCLASEACIICTCLFSPCATIYVLLYFCTSSCFIIHVYVTQETYLNFHTIIICSPCPFFLHVLSYCESCCLFAPITTNTEVTFQP